MPLKKITLTHAQVHANLMRELIVKLNVELKEEISRTIRYEFSRLRLQREPRLTPRAVPPSPISMFSDDEKR